MILSQSLILSSFTSSTMQLTLNLRPRVPVEVAENVIDQLADDHHESTLRSCALVCQAWLPRSRSRLFRTIHIVDLRALRSLHLILLSSSILPPLVQSVDLEGIPTRFNPQGTYLASQTWTAEIQGLDHDKLESALGCSTPDANITSDIFDAAPLVLLPLLVNVHRWTFRGKSGHYYSVLQLRSIVPECILRHSVIYDLSLVDIHVRCMADIARLLLGLPALRSLEVKNVDIFHQGIPLDPLLDRLSTRLRLSVLQVNIILHLYEHCIDAQNSVLQIYNVENVRAYGSLSLLHTLGKAVAPHVNHLSSDVKEITAEEDWPKMKGELRH